MRRISAISILSILIFSINIAIHAKPLANQPPVVSAGANQTIVLPQTALMLTGSASDSDGNIVSYQWTRRYGPSSVIMTNANTLSLGLSNLISGGYGFRLTVQDNSGATAYADVKVTVNINPNATCSEGQYLTSFSYNNSTFRAWLHIPTGFCSNANRYPLVIFHHGDGEKGTEPHLLLRATGTPPNYFNERTFDPNMIVISPQLDYVRSSGAAWSQWVGGWGDQTIQHVKTLYPNRVDDDKIHMTGLSGGSGRTVIYTIANSTKLASFSTVAYVCIQPDPTNAQYTALGAVSSWLFQNSNDARGCFDGGLPSGLLTGIQSNNPIHAPLYTIYNDSGHGGWHKAYSNTRTYDNVQSTNASAATYPNLWQWMKSKVRAGGNTATNTPTATNIPTRSDTIGVYKNGIFSLRYTNSAGATDLTVAFGGDASDLSVVGDWNGDGIDTIGVYRGGTGVYLLSDANTTPTVAYSLVFGNPGDTPFAGKWSSDMTHDGVGVYRNSNGILYQKKQLATGFSDFFAIFGNPGDQGYGGDFDGNGFDSIGIYRSANQTWYMTNNSTPNGITFSDVNFAWDINTARPVLGDWNGDGISTVGYYTNAGVFALHSTNATTGSDNTFAFGATGGQPIAGKWTAPSQPTMANIVGGRRNDGANTNDDSPGD
jgi:hypothetical protein